MRSKTVRRAGSLIFVLCLAAVGAGVAVVAQEPDPISPPPESLRPLYPPKSRTRVYTLEMLELGRLMGSLSMDVATLDQGNHLGAIREEFDRFAEHYEKVAGMVPEWEGYFQLAVLEEARELLAGEPDRSTLGPLVKTLESSCTRCHAAELFKVQALYHWPRFADLSAIDEEGREVRFHETMVELSNRLGALPTAVAREDWEEALAHQKEMTRQLSLMEDSCYGCHDEPREYFVDKQVKGEFLKLGGMVRRRVIEQDRYREINDAIYQRSCIPCHQVHMPAAFLQQQLEP